MNEEKFLKKIKNTFKKSISKKEYLKNLFKFVVCFIIKINSTFFDISYDLNIDKICAELSDGYCNEIQDFFKWLYFSKITIVEKINLCLIMIKKISWSNNNGARININYLKNYLNGYINSFSNDDCKILVNNYEILKTKLQGLVKYGYEISCIDNNAFLIIETEENILLDEINNDVIYDLFFKFKSSSNLQDKEEIMTNLAVKISNVFSSEKILLNEYYFSDENIKKMKRNFNGYFRHTVLDSGDSEISNEWLNFSNDEKEYQLRKYFNICLYIFLILKSENKLNLFLEKINLK